MARLLARLCSYSPRVPARRNGRDFLTRVRRAPAALPRCFILAAGCSGSGLSSCLQSISLRRTSSAHSRRRRSDPRRLRLVQQQDGRARFGPDGCLGANPGFLIRATRAQIVDRWIGRDQQRPFRRIAVPRAARDMLADGRVRSSTRILNQFGSDAEDMAAIEAVCMLLAYALIARAARGTANQSMNLSSLERLPPCATGRLW